MCSTNSGIRNDDGALGFDTVNSILDAGPGKVDAGAGEELYSGRGLGRPPEQFPEPGSKLVMFTEREFSGHHKPGHYKTRTGCSRAFPWAPGDPCPVKTQRKWITIIEEAKIT